MEEKMRVILVEPNKKACIDYIEPGYRSLQAIVGGTFQAIYPYEDLVALICNDEGKLLGMPPNRALYDEDGKLYDIIAGTFLVVGLSEDDFCSLPPDLAEKYLKQFLKAERFFNIEGEIVVIPVD